jgi:hypothetical protein
MDTSFEFLFLLPFTMILTFKAVLYNAKSRDSSVGIVTVIRAGRSGF